MRVFYPLPGLPRNGGVKVCIQHSHLLNLADIETYVLTPTPDCSPYPRYKHAKFMTFDACLKIIEPDDIFVFCWAASIRFFYHLSNRFIFFSQGVVNHSDPVPHIVWLNERFELATVGQYSRNFFFYKYNKSSRIVNNWVDSTVFYPSSVLRIARQVGLIQHRQYSDESLSEMLLQKGFTVRPISGDEETVATQMKSCDYFASAAPGVFNGQDAAEGFALPCAEAMASGALVACYHNHGSLEYAMDRVNCRISSTKTPTSLVELICELETCDQKESTRACAIRTITNKFSAPIVTSQILEMLKPTESAR
jgi:hypothetical protein